MNNYPERIACLTEETTETIYLLGEDWRIVGISCFTVRPARARKEKPIVSAFTKARIDDIVQLKPDLVLGFSDIQAGIAAELIAAGIEVHIFNHRTVSGILRMIRMLGAMLGCPERAAALVTELQAGLEDVRSKSLDHEKRPLVYFEEWNDPIISGIGWVSELIEVAGGVDCFAELSVEPMAKNRIIADPLEVVRRDPDIIIGSWCGKPFNPKEVVSRPEWDKIAAVRNGRVHAIESSIILQPGPAALGDGLTALHRVINNAFD